MTMHKTTPASAIFYMGYHKHNKGQEKLPAKNVWVVLVPFDTPHKIGVAIPAFTTRSTECPFTSSRCCVPYFDGQIVRSSSNHCVVDTPLDVIDPLRMTL